MLNNYTPDPYGTTAQDIIKLVECERQESLDYVRDKYQACQRWTDAFYGIYTGNIANYLNDVTLPLVFATIMSDVARKANAIFGSWPIVTLHGFPSGSEGIAHKNELLINMQLKEADSFRKAVRFFMQADINGTAIAEAGWSFIQRLRQFRTYLPGSPQMIEVKDFITEFDGPNWDVVDLPDFWPQAGKTHIKDMSRYTRRSFVDYDDLLELNSGDGFQSFDPAALKKLAETGMPSTRSSDEWMALTKYRSFNDFMGSSAHKYDKPVEIWERRGLVPMEFAPDGVRNRVITIGNGSVVLRNEPDKLLLGRHRIIHYSPTPDPYHFVGIGKAQIAEPLQAAASRLVSSKLDGLDLFTKPAFVAKAGSVGTQNMFVKPGKVFQINTKGSSINDAIQPLPVNLQPLQLAFQEIAFLDSMIQKGTGIDEAAVMGVSTGASNEMTARQFIGQTEAAMTRLALEAMLASTEVVEPLAELFRDMNRTMLPLPKQFSMLGTKAIISPISGLPMPPEEGIVTMPGELNHGWTAKAFGPMFMLTKSMQRADALQLAQTMMANPVWIQYVNWYSFARKMFGLYDWDPDEMMVANPLLQQLAAQMGMGADQAVSAGNEASGGAGGASGQMMAPIQPGTEPVDNAPLGEGP